MELTQEFYSFARGDPGDIRVLGQEREGTLWNLEAEWPIPGVRGAGLWLPHQGRSGSLEELQGWECLSGPEQGMP